MSQNVTLALATFAATAHVLPAEVRHAARRALVDHIAVAAAGSDHAAVQAVLGTASALGSAGPHRIIGAALRVDPLTAALANGTAAHVLDWDDTVLPTRMHLSAALYPPLLALGERLDLSLDALVEPFVVGFEIAQRLCMAVFPALHERRWHNTAIVGAIGAASACGRLLGLDAPQIVQALGIAANSASGLASSYGTMAKALNVGRAAARGLESVCLAANGLVGHADTFAAGGFLAMYDDAPRLDALLARIGQSWWIRENGFKAYPCGVVAHAAIDAARALRARHPRPDHIEVQVTPAALELMGKADPATPLEAKFSLPFVVAAAWVFGDLTPDAFAADSLVPNGAVHALMRRMTIVAQPALGQTEAVVDATSRGVFERLHVVEARGTRGRPLSDDDLVAKAQQALRAAGLGAPDLPARLLAENMPAATLLAALSR